MCQPTSLPPLPSLQVRMKRLFDLFDHNCDGHLLVDELREGIRTHPRLRFLFGLC